MSYNKKIFIFDLDGTLIDSFPGISMSFKHTLEQLDYQTPDDEEIRLAIGPGLHKALETLLACNDPQLIGKAVEIYRNFHDSTGYKHSTVYPGITDLLKLLKEHRIRLFIASMKSDHIVKPVIEHLNLSDYFEDAVGSSRQGLTTSKAQMLEALANKYNFDLKDSVLIGDTLHDANAAKQANIDFYAVSYGYGLPEELNYYNRLFSSAAEIEMFLRSKLEVERFPV